MEEIKNNLSIVREEKINLKSDEEKVNLKSDIEAKAEFVKLLGKEHFEAKIKSNPTDIVAIKNNEVYYFEIKYTTKPNNYFGAATLTEWKCAMKNIDRFYFVVAYKKSDKWVFKRYTPMEFMKYSSIPPFKIFFLLDVEKDIANKSLKRKSKRKMLTNDRLNDMIGLYDDKWGD